MQLYSIALLLRWLFLVLEHLLHGRLLGVGDALLVDVRDGPGQKRLQREVFTQPVVRTPARGPRNIGAR